MSQMPDKIWLHKDTKYSTSDIVSAYQYEFAREIEDEGIENFVEYIRTDIVEDKFEDTKEQVMRDIAWKVHAMISEGKSIAEIDHYVSGICDF